MFSTNLIQHIQSLDNTFLTYLMKGFHALGEFPLMLIAMLIIFFGFDFKKGIVIINILVLTFLGSQLLKSHFNYPVPADISTSLLHQTEFSADGLNDIAPKHFWENFSSQLLNITQTDNFERSGFPSSNAAAQTAFWLSFILLFRKNWAYYVGISLMILSGFAQLYLGKHFLADVLIGWILGFIFSRSYIYFIRSIKFFRLGTQSFSSLKFLLLPIVFLPFTIHSNPSLMGALFAFNTASFLQIQLMNVPKNVGEGARRILTALIGINLILLAYYLPHLLGFQVTGILGFIISFALVFAALFGGLGLLKKLNLVMN